MLNSPVQYSNAHSVLVVFKSNINCDFLFAPKLYTGKIQFVAQRSTFFIIFF